MIYRTVKSANESRVHSYCEARTGSEEKEKQKCQKKWGVADRLLIVWILVYVNDCFSQLPFGLLLYLFRKKPPG